MIQRWVFVLFCLHASLAYSLEPLGWNGFVTGCTTNMYWTVGSFEKAKDVQDACQQAGQSHAKRPGGRALTVHGVKGELIKYVDARCYFEPKNNLCGLIMASPQCPAGSDFVFEAEACFCGISAKEAGGKCVPGTDCDEMVKRLKQLKVPQSDSRYGFYRNQTCIAEKACAARTQMEDKDWLNRVVPDFVNPLIQKSGQWKQIMDECKDKSRYALGALRCQRSMATYHIEADLQSALNRQGCGTAPDWKKVGDIIGECIKAGAQQDIVEGGQWLGIWKANSDVQDAREKIRSTCLKQRK